jgi:prepilin-type N-terminal cleavage/methylation domain-containing protein
MNTKKSAFTLIELLVVIAIIAILAAILFPVFAQARTSAKRMVAVSNQKQILTAFVLYAQDADDHYPIRESMNGNGLSWNFGICSVENFGCPTWDKSIQRYLKSIEVLESGLDRAPRVPTNLGNIKRSFRVARNLVRGVGGVNTWGGSTPTPVEVYSSTAVPAPSSTIMLTEQRNRVQILNTTGSYIWYAYWEQWGWDSGSGNTLAYTDANPNQLYSGLDYGPSNNIAVFGFADTHVKTFPKGYIFPGYRRSADRSAPVNPNFKGVCLDADDYSGNGPANDCPLPQE